MFDYLEEKFLIWGFNSHYKKCIVKNKKFIEFMEENNLNKNFWERDLDDIINVIFLVYSYHFKTPQDIKQEKYKLHITVDKCTDSSLESFVTIMFTIGITVLATYYSMKNITQNEFMILGISMLIVIYVYQQLIKLTNKMNRYEISFYNLCLNSLEDIEKDMKDNKEKYMAYDEVAATKEIVEIKDQEPQAMNGKYNFTLNFNFPSVFDVMAKRMFRKKK